MDMEIYEISSHYDIYNRYHIFMLVPEICFVIIILFELFIFDYSVIS